MNLSRLKWISENDGFHGVGILIRKGISFRRIPFVSSSDVVIVTTLNIEPNVVIASVYFPPQMDIQTFHDDVTRLPDLLYRFTNVLLAGNFHARHSILGDITITCRGKALANLINASSFRCLNNPPSIFLQLIVQQEVH